MNFEPQKFFIGLMDFFSILLPGAILTYLGMDQLGPFVLGAGHVPAGGTEAWAVFLFSSYLLGHFIFLIGAWVLDEHVYDRLRTATDTRRVTRLADGKRFADPTVRWLATWLIKSQSDQALVAARKIRDHYLDPLGASSTINVFQWCKARLLVGDSGSVAEVERFEAHSKFFRSLMVVLCVLVPYGVASNRPGLGLAGVGMLLLASWRYIDQRSKSVDLAYWYVITQESQREGGFRSGKRPAGEGPTHAGGVVFRKKGKEREYLLVQATKAPGERVLPKGHIEQGEPTRETAVREVHEETGVWARIVSDLNPVSYAVDHETVEVRYYLMEALQEGPSQEVARKHEWLALEEALKSATHESTRKLLRQADECARNPRRRVA
jgi:8-oxo-dGTP pyrophosphatase MutT (NUDIX family)